MLTIFEILILVLTPHVQFLTVCLGIAAHAIEIERETFLRGDDLLYWGYRAPKGARSDAALLNLVAYSRVLLL